MKENRNAIYVTLVITTVALTALMSMCMLHAQKAMYVRFAKGWTTSILR